MRSKIAILSALALHVLASPVPVPQTVNTPCHEVHIFLARGSEEPYPGRQSNLVDAICRGISSCGYEDIVYPATFANYCEASVPVGVANGKAQIEAYSTRCPDSKLVLSGYSQVWPLEGAVRMELLIVEGRTYHRRYSRRRRRCMSYGRHPSDYHRNNSQLPNRLQK